MHMYVYIATRNIVTIMQHLFICSHNAYHAQYYKVGQRELFYLMHVLKLG